MIETAARSVVLTGASRGLGAALFHALRGDGARILALARTFTESQYALAAANAERVILRRTDLRHLDQLPSAAELARFAVACGPDDEVVLVHNAATVEPVGLVGAVAPEAMAEAVRVNLVAPMVLTNAFLAGMPERLSRLRVVYVGSGAAHRRYPGWATYCATKAGAEAFMGCVAEAAHRPCVVEVIDPRAMETAMQRTIREQGSGLPGHERLLERHELGHIPQAEAVARDIVARYFPPVHPVPA